MSLHLSFTEAAWFLPFVAPICLWVIWSDLSTMRIPNTSVLALAAVFVVIGPFLLPLDVFAWRLVQLAVVLVLGFLANMAGMMGGGDSKFLAAAAPFVASGDGTTVTFIFAANLLATFCAHRFAKNSSLRQLAPDWVSWTRDDKFPMGFALGSSLVIYLGLGLFYGA